MDRLGFARSRGFWVRFGWGILLGLLSALGAYIFVAIMDFGINLLWPEPPDSAFLSGSWQIVLIMTVAGFVVGLLYRFTKAREINSNMAMVKGDMDTRPVPAALLVSLISLVRRVQEAVEAQAKPIIQKNMEYPGDERILALKFNPIVPIHI